MKTFIFLACIIILSLASGFDEVKAIARNDQCAFERLEILKPLIEAQIQKVKKVNFKHKLRIQ